MMDVKLRLKTLTHLLIFLWTLSSVQAQNQFSRKQVLEDMAYLRTSLEATHPNLYAYTPKAEFERNYRRVKASLKQDSFSLLEATSLLQRIISKANNGHTEIPFPGEAYGEYAYAGGTLFPLEIAFEGGKALVRKNWSENDQIQAGAEVLRINGQSIEDIRARLAPQISAERPYFKNAKIELYSFPRLYWQVFGQQDAFEVDICSDGLTKTYQLPAVAVIEGYEMKRNELFNFERSLRFIDQIAYLHPGSFLGDEQAYQHFIDSAFAKIQERKTEKLIIDLRYNAGGNDGFSDYMVAYLANRPFKWNSRFTLKTSPILKAQVRQLDDTTSAYWQKILRQPDGTVYDYDLAAYSPQPEQKRFKGEVFVLINRQSHSQSAVTAAQIQDYGFGTIVGEETGEYPSLYASSFQYSLPNTGVTVNIAKGYTVRVSGDQAKRGVVPDIYIRDHLLDEKDEVLEGILEKIN